MKKNALTIRRLPRSVPVLVSAACLLLTFALTPPVLRAQETTDKSPPNLVAEGVINNIRPESFTVDSAAGKVSIDYSPKTTRYVDPNDNPVAVSLVTAGLPVKVHYMQIGERAIATKVVVSKARTVTTTETASTAPGGGTTSVGVVTEMGPETFLLRTDGAAEPDLYGYASTTTYVDEKGSPVSVDSIKTGAPVTVFYSKIGNRMVASKVMVRNIVATETVTDKTTTTRTTVTPPAQPAPAPQKP